MYYVAIDVGCIECGEMTTVLGVFTDRTVAKNILDEHEKRQKENWHGEHQFFIEIIDCLDKEIRVDY